MNCMYVDVSAEAFSSFRGTCICSVFVMEKLYTQYYIHPHINVHVRECRMRASMVCTYTCFINLGFLNHEFEKGLSLSLYTVVYQKTIDRRFPCDIQAQ